MFNGRFNNNIFYNIGVVKGKIEVLSNANIPRSKSETLKILDEISNKMNLIFTQAVELEAKNRNIYVNDITYNEKFI